MITPREKRHDSTRQKILDTARGMIAEVGLEAFSLRQLAGQIDYSPAAIYKYFGSKEEILQAIRDEFWATTLREEDDTSGLTPPEKLIASGRSYLAFAEAYPEHYLLVFNSPALPPGGLSDIYHDPRFSGLIGMVREGVEGGFFKLPEGYTSESMAIHLWSSAHGIVMLRFTILKENREEFTRVAEQIMTAFIQSITVK
jgi:AcrR family transcriptional regulator